MYVLLYCFLSDNEKKWRNSSRIHSSVGRYFLKNFNLVTLSPLKALMFKRWCTLLREREDVNEFFAFVSHIKSVTKFLNIKLICRRARMNEVTKLRLIFWYNMWLYGSIHSGCSRLIFYGNVNILQFWL